MGTLTSVLILAATVAGTGAYVPWPPIDLRTNFVPNPLGVDTTPFFSWTPNDPNHVRLPPMSIQSAYQIEMYGENGKLLWDTSRVPLHGNAIPYVYYTGAKALSSDTQYSWRVRIWGNESVASAWSGSASFSTGILGEDTSLSWNNAQWIGGFMLRRSFSLPSGKVRRASVFVCGIGYYHLWVDGSKAGGDQHTLNPTTSNFKKRAHYIAHDITGLLSTKDTAHVIGLTLGHGFNADMPRAIMILRVQMENGAQVQITSDDKWTSNQQPPIVSDSLYRGETYDARLEVPEWSTPSCKKCNSWISPRIGNYTGAPVLSAQLSESIQPMTEIKPVALNRPSANMWVFDMGQNFAGWTRIKVSGPAGTAVRIRHAEALMHPPYGPEDGTIYTENLRTAIATDTYIMKGHGLEVHEPCFTYHGFRYVEVTGLPDGYAPTLDTITGVVVYSALKRVSSIGKLENRILDQIWQNTLWSAASNLYGIPTDCSQRDERRGWLGDAALASASDLLHWDMRAFYTNFLRLIEDEQTEIGGLPWVAPDNGPIGPIYSPSNSDFDLDWTTAFPTLSWGIVKYGGATPGIADRWAGLTKYMDFISTLHSNSGLKNLDNVFGDWCSPLQTDMPAYMGHCGPTIQQQMSNTHLMSSATYLRDLRNMAEIATALGKDAEASKYHAMFEELVEEFNAAFFDKEKKTYADGSQVTLAMPLWLEIVPEEDKYAVFDNLVDSIVNKNNNHIVVGIIGMRYIYEVLYRYGRSDIAIIAATQETAPSFGAQILSKYEPATTLWELWDSDTREPDMNSRNHIMFNGVDMFLMKAVGGLDMATDSIGWSRIVVNPQLAFINADGQAVTSSNVKIGTPRGEAAVSWSTFDNSRRKSALQKQRCASAAENTVLRLECSHGERIFGINYASFGTEPTGSCDNYQALSSKCSANTTKEILSRLCVGHRICPVIASNAQFGGADPCPMSEDKNVLVASWECSKIFDDTLLQENVVAIVNVTVPATSEADVFIPKSPHTSFMISVDNIPVWRDSESIGTVDGIITAEDAGKYIKFQTLSGKYSFVVSAK